MRKYILLIAFAVSLAACKKSGSDSSAQPDGPAPGKVVLTLPAQNSVCLTGTVTSGLQSVISLSWNAATNTDGYQLDIKNLLTGAVQTLLSTTNQAQVALLRNTPYSWSVTSRSFATPVFTQSDVWKFYVAGDGVTSYAPFPAVLTSPAYGKNIAAGTTTINLTWTDSDVDNDLAGFDVYFGTAATPPLFKSNVSDMFLNNVTVSANTTYYWKIVAKDALGNTSVSDSYQFKVN